MIRAQTYEWKPNTERSAEVFKELEAHIQHHPATKTATAHYFILRREVCCDAYFFLRYGGVHPSQKRRILDKLERGQRSWAQNPDWFAKSYVRKDGLKCDYVKAKILTLAKIYGDEQPDDKNPGVMKIEMDPGINKGYMYYNDFLDGCIEENFAPCSYSYFIVLWGQTYEKEFKESGVRIKLRDEARKKRFHECSRCAYLKKELAECAPEDFARRKGLRHMRFAHYTHEVRVEKQLYYKRRQEGRETMRQEHDGVLSVILDGEDQGEHQYPHQPRPPEWLEKMTRVKLKVQGVFFHGMMLCLFIMPPWLGSGASMAVTVLIYALWMAQAKLGRLPSRLYIQSDNGSENKNRAFLYFLCLLVWFHVFKIIEWHLLIPGHTHEDIDAWFSVISRWLVRTWIMTLSDLLKRLPNAFTGEVVKVQLIWVSSLFNVWQFFDRTMMGAFHGITLAHSFKVEFNCDGEVAVWYKSWSRDRIWKPFLKDEFGRVIWSEGDEPMPSTCPHGINSFFKKAPGIDEVPMTKSLVNGVQLNCGFACN